MQKIFFSSHPSFLCLINVPVNTARVFIVLLALAHKALFFRDKLCSGKMTFAALIIKSPFYHQVINPRLLYGNIFCVPLCRMISTVLATFMKGFDVKALRAFRVLRPLRLVSGVPSKIFKILRPFKMLM